MRYLFLVLACMLQLPAAVLTIDKDSTTIDGGTYDYANTISGRKYITIRNVTFKNTIPVTGNNPEGGLFFTGCRYITIENCVIDGQFRSCRGIRLDGCARVTVRGCTIRNMNDDAMRVESCSYLTVEDNTIYSLLGCGTDGNVSTNCTCNNGHADGIQVVSCIHFDIHRNLIYGVTGTSGLMIGGGGSIVSPARFGSVSNNLIHTPKASAALYLRYGIMDVELYNNTVRGGRYMSVWFEKTAGEMTDLTLVNNVFGKFSWEIPYNPEEHTIHNNVISDNLVTDGQTVPADNKIDVDPQLAGPLGNNDTTGITAANFLPTAASPCVNAGKADTDVPETDFFGNLRNGVPDIGGIERGGVSRIVLPEGPGFTWSEAVTVHPSPMADRLLITVSGYELADARCGIYDRQGRLVKNIGTARAWDGRDATGNMVKPGVYYIHLNSTAGAGPVLSVLKTR